jgi:hypothetical protein
MPCRAGATIWQPPQAPQCTISRILMARPTPERRLPSVARDSRPPLQGYPSQFGTALIVIASDDGSRVHSISTICSSTSQCVSTDSVFSPPSVLADGLSSSLTRRMLVRVWKSVAGAGIAIAVIAAVGLTQKVPDGYTAVLNARFLSSRDERLTYFFGECEPAGYGYLKRVLSAYSRIESSPLKRPTIRYRDYNRRSEYLFEPTRFEADPSVLVGVGLIDSDLREREIGTASRGPDGLWRFAVDSNFDLLTRIDVELEGGSTRHLRVQLYRNERDSTPVWSSAEVAPAAAIGKRTVQFVPTPPLRQFRSGLVDPFVIRVDGGLSIYRVTAYGVIVDVQGYRIVHRKGACFTAVDERQTNRWTLLIRELESSDD